MAACVRGISRRADEILVITGMHRYRLRPVTLEEARRFIAEHHRHCIPPVGWLWGVGLEDGEGRLVGVAVVGRPVARHLQDGRTLEITRVCVLDGMPMANSVLYGAVLRAAEALGYQRAVTYTLEGESGASLRAVGFVLDGFVEENEWNRSSRPRYEVDLFGNRRRPPGRRVRWVRAIPQRWRSAGRRSLDKRRGE
jgi:hypothetical protein